MTSLTEAINKVRESNELRQPSAAPSWSQSPLSSFSEGQITFRHTTLGNNMSVIPLLSEQPCVNPSPRDIFNPLHLTCDRD
uniref:Uncharacterized protein n=1 Tax=Acanthochromis polyacanthus TaxID=80966 RepID=A0A3Q1FBI6_9TELE